MFNKLYGKEREIVLAIQGKSDDDAISYLIEQYAEHGNLTVMNELKSLAGKGYISGTLKSKTGIPGMMDIRGGLHLTVLPDCRNYFEMEKYYENSSQSIHINAPNNNGNIIGRDATNVNQTITIGTIANEILELISNIKNQINALDVDSGVKDSLEDDLDMIVEQVESPAPKATRIKKAVESIKAFIENGANATTLAVNFYTLFDLIAKMLP